MYALPVELKVCFQSRTNCPWNNKTNLVPDFLKIITGWPAKCARSLSPMGWTFTRIKVGNLVKFQCAHQCRSYWYRQIGPNFRTKGSLNSLKFKILHANLLEWVVINYRLKKYLSVPFNFRFLFPLFGANFCCNFVKYIDAKFPDACSLVVFWCLFGWVTIYGKRIWCE